MEKLNVQSDITLASTMPASFYTSDYWYESCKEKIFAATWQFCTSRERLSQRGQIIPHTILPGMLDEPVLFVRGEDDRVRCISNVCTHRANLLVHEPCVAKNIICGYHGRRFNLCGEFQHMPEFHGAQMFPSAADDLANIPHDHLGNFLFASLNPQISFEDTMTEIKKRLFWMPFSSMRYYASRSRDYIIEANWALYCENYLEGLHLPFVHKGLRSEIDFQGYTTEIYRYSNLQLALASNDDQSFNLPRESIDYGKSIAAYYYWLFPNTMLNFYPWGCSVNVVQPVGLSQTRVSFLSFVMDESRLDTGAGGALDTVEMEDEAIVEAVQKGVRSRFYSKGRYSPRHEKGTHHFHRLLCEFLALKPLAAFKKEVEQQCNAKHE